MPARLAGTSVCGPTTRTSGQPSVSRAWISLRATRECSTSPTMATRRFSNPPLWWRMVSISSKPCVGWAWRPSPALMTCTCGATLRAIRYGAPLSLWRTTKISAAMALRLAMVSSSVSPLAVDERAMSRLNTSALKRLAAISKVVRVRVLFSKNRLNTLLPRSSGTFLTSRLLTLTNCSAVSRICVSISRESPSVASR